MGLLIRHRRDNAEVRPCGARHHVARRWVQCYVHGLFQAVRRAMTFSYRVDRWTDDGNSILDYVAAVGDLAVARAAYRAACRRWPEAKISLRQGARVMERSWEEA